MLILILLLFSSCHNHAPYTIEKNVMQMPLCVQVEGNLSKHQKELCHKTIRQTFREVDRIYNNWNPSSEISRFNHTRAYEPFDLSEELATFLRHVHEIVVLTEGRFDPTVDPLQKIWKERLTQGITPTDAELKRLIPAIGWHHIHLEGNTIYKDHSATTIDLSAIAKGHAVDVLATRLHRIGLKSVFVNWGGEIRTIGKHPSGRKWHIAIHKTTHVIEMEDRSIATSGDYLQQWCVEGVTYSHIIDPSTKKPLIVQQSSITSASIVMESCMMADALATALMLFSSAAEAEAWAHTHIPQAGVWLIENASVRVPSPFSSPSP